MPQLLNWRTNGYPTNTYPCRIQGSAQACLGAHGPRPDLNTPEGDELEVLFILAENYEDAHYPVEKPDPIEAIRFRMEQSGLTVSDLRPYIGPSHRVYEVLNRTRPLTLTMIRKLHEGLKISADVLIGAAV